MRKRKKINWEQVEKLAQLQCTVREISSFIGVSTKTLYNKFNRNKLKEVVARGNDAGKISLRRAQWKAALQHGNVQMLKHLGENYLDQSEKRTINQKSEIKFSDWLEELTGGKDDNSDK